MDKPKEIKKLRAQKAKFKRQGNYKLVAEYANSIGNLCSEMGEHRQAIDEHECELSLCQHLKDLEGEAIANRKLGECYMELVELDSARQYVSMYLELARTLPNQIELQRAYVTMGRFCLVEIPTLIPRTVKRRQSEKKAESAFMKALEWCDKLKSTLQSTECQEMRARAILNLGLLADIKGEDKEAVGNFKNAGTIARKHNLFGTLVTSLHNLVEVQARQANFADARSTVEEAMSYNVKVDCVQQIASAKLFAQITVEMGDVGVGLDTIKPIIRSMEHAPERDSLYKVAVTLYKMIMAKRKLSVSNDDDKRKIFEKIGDYCCDLGAFHHSLLSYQKTLDIINQLKLDHEVLPPILVSMARTYQDLKKYDQAINYYCQEAKMQQQLSNFDQAAKTLLNVANCMENGNIDVEMIQQCYKKAESHALNAADPKLQLLVLNNFRDSMKALGNEDKYEDCCARIEQLCTAHGLSRESQEESQLSEADDDAETSDGGFELSDHSSDEEHESEVVKSTRCKPFKIWRNEIGETKLHQAVIKGKTDLVIELLNKGHPIDIRDHAGWLPIHEAAIHNRVDIARMLVEHGSDVNDRAGKEGVTPLHDACASGCCETIQFLMESGASVIAKDNENKHPLDHMMDYLHRSYPELDEEERGFFEELESMLRTSMSRKGITPKCKPFKAQLQQKQDDIAMEMPSMPPPSRKALDKSDVYSLSSQAEHEPPEIPRSPEMSATELYRSAVAEVRKSAKRVAVPPSATEPHVKTPVPALLPKDCEDNLLATGDWLVDDYNASPVKKKQRVSDSPPSKRNRLQRNVAQCSRESTPSVIGETPEKGQNRLVSEPMDTTITSSSQGPEPMTSPVMTEKADEEAAYTEESAGHSLSEKASADAVQQLKAPRSRRRLPSFSQNIGGEDLLSQPLTPAFSMSARKQATNDSLTATDVSRTDLGAKALDMPLNDMGTNSMDSVDEILSKPIVVEKRVDANDLPENETVGLKPDYRGQDADTAPPPESLRAEECADDRIEGQKENVDQGISQAHSELSIEWSQHGFHQGRQQLSPLFTPIDDDIPVTNTVSQCDNVRIPVTNNTHKHKSVKRTKKHALDDLLNDINSRPALRSPTPGGSDANSTRSSAFKVIGGRVAKTKFPTSTPLRKSAATVRPGHISPAGSSVSHLGAPRGGTLTVNHMSKDSGFHNDRTSLLNASVSTIRPPLHMLNNSTLIDAVGSNSSIRLAELNSSYHQHIRVLVQWKDRTLLIPIPRCESPSVGWLCEEFVRRLRRRKSSQRHVPTDPSLLVLTRALDGAELFCEDNVIDLLVDNEKVIALPVDED